MPGWFDQIRNSNINTSTNNNTNTTSKFQTEGEEEHEAEPVISPDIIDNYFEKEEGEGEFDRPASTTKVRYNGIIGDADVQATLRCKLDSGTLTSGTDSDNNSIINTGDSTVSIFDEIFTRDYDSADRFDFGAGDIYSINTARTTDRTSEIGSSDTLFNSIIHNGDTSDLRTVHNNGMNFEINTDTHTIKNTTRTYDSTRTADGIAQATTVNKTNSNATVRLIGNLADTVSDTKDAIAPNSFESSSSITIDDLTNVATNCINVKLRNVPNILQDSEIIENNNLDAQDGMYGSQQDDLQFYFLQLNEMFVLDKVRCHTT